MLKSEDFKIDLTYPQILLVSERTFTYNLYIQVSNKIL